MTGPLELQLIVMLGLLGTLVVAGVSDAARYIIPNSVVLALVGLFLVAAPFAPNSLAWPSHIGAGVAVFAVGCLLFQFRLMGGGDVKLWAACALWTGLDLLLTQVVYVTLIGVTLALALVLIRAAFERVARLLGGRARLVLPRLLREGEAVPYGVAIAAGSILLAGEISSKFA